MTQLELELQGEVDKYLVVLFFRGPEDEGAVSEGLRQLLFDRYQLAAASRPRAPSATTRPRGSRTAVPVARVALPGPPPAGALAREAQKFWRLGQREKLETIAVSFFFVRSA